MNKHFFELPKAVKRAVWAALMAEWAKKKAGAAARCASVVPAFSAAVVAPVQGCFCCLPKGSDSSLNGISLQW